MMMITPSFFFVACPTDTEEIKSVQNNKNIMLLRLLFIFIFNDVPQPFLHLNNCTWMNSKGRWRRFFCFKVRYPKNTHLKSWEKQNHASSWPFYFRIRIFGSLILLQTKWLPSHRSWPPALDLNDLIIRSSLTLRLLVFMSKRWADTQC